MARPSVMALLILLAIMMISFVSNSEARKLWVVMKKDDTSVTSTSTTHHDHDHDDHHREYPQQSLFLSALPKGKVPSSAPSKKGQALAPDHSLVARHLIAFDRNLRSVPSPGIGH